MTGQSFVFLSFRQSITFFLPVDLAVHPHPVGASPSGRCIAIRLPPNRAVLSRQMLGIPPSY